jgi:hypothetical protein
MNLWFVQDRYFELGYCLYEAGDVRSLFSLPSKSKGQVSRAVRVIGRDDLLCVAE